MTARALMVMGTGSDVGKSLVVAGLCRAFTNRGFSVAPFKPQNMSNNAAVTGDGGEIGRAQALQARACRRTPVTAMNPMLLKPEHETGAQVVVRGKRIGSMSARDYFAARQRFMPDVLGAFDELAQTHDLVIVEGAGSASEVNLRHGDLANFGFARAAQIPAMLVGDIHRGGVIASIIGTLEVVDPADADLIVASLVNRFYGDPTLFEDGKRFIEGRTGRPCFGPLPHFDGAHRLPAEDVLGLDTQHQRGDGMTIAVPRLARIANFDDLDPLRSEPNVNLEIVNPGSPLPRDARLVILPGSKATRSDLEFFKAQGWDIDLLAHYRAGGHVLGICGGYQMLGSAIADPQGIEDAPGESAGLGLLDVQTVMAPTKQLRIEHAIDRVSGQPVSGYHMHMGETAGPDTARPFALFEGAPQGATSADGRVMGTYLHGLFAADGFRRAFLERLAIPPDPLLDFEARIEETLDQLATHFETHLDLDAILALARTHRVGS